MRFGCDGYFSDRWIRILGEIFKISWDLRNWKISVKLLFKKYKFTKFFKF